MFRVSTLSATVHLFNQNSKDNRKDNHVDRRCVLHMIVLLIFDHATGAETGILTW